MEIEEFIKKSEGEWNSMRSGHSLAFKQFEEVTSKIKIRIVKKNNQQIQNLLEQTNYSLKKVISPFEIEWEGQSDWQNDTSQEEFKGSSILIPIPLSNKNGIIIRSMGYAERAHAYSEYYFLSDGTLVLSTKYEHTCAEERIWFINQNVRCRSSVISSLKEKGIHQISFASEVRKINLEQNT